MLDLVTLILVAVAAVGFTYFARKKDANYPNVTQGPPDHLSMPEVKYVFPLEADHVNASCYAIPGRSVQIGNFVLH